MLPKLRGEREIMISIRQGSAFACPGSTQFFATVLAVARLIGSERPRYQRALPFWQLCLATRLPSTPPNAKYNRTAHFVRGRNTR